MLNDAEYLKTQELIKKVAETKRRESSASEAVRRARKRIAARGEFIPKPPKSSSTLAKF
jgi:hypothetical protein